MKSGRQESVGLTVGQIQDLNLSTKGNQRRVFLGCGWILFTFVIELEAGRKVLSGRPESRNYSSVRGDGMP